MSRLIHRVVVGVFLVAAQIACVPVYAPPGYWNEHEGVTPPPPAAQEEPPGDPPQVGLVWMPGYWFWSGLTYVWITGRWAVPPTPSHVWVRSGWIYRGGRHHFVRGYWAPPNYRVRYRYVNPRRSGPISRPYRPNRRQSDRKDRRR